MNKVQDALQKWEVLKRVIFVRYTHSATLAVTGIVDLGEELAVE